MLIVAGRAVLNHKDKKHDTADDRDQRDQQPPTATVSVMKPPNRYRYAGN